jgi:hypothetical protein
VPPPDAGPESAGRVTLRRAAPRDHERLPASPSWATDRTSRSRARPPIGSRGEGTPARVTAGGHCAHLSIAYSGTGLDAEPYAIAIAAADPESATVHVGDVTLIRQER